MPPFQKFPRGSPRVDCVYMQSKWGNPRGQQGTPLAIFGTLDPYPKAHHGPWAQPQIPLASWRYQKMNTHNLPCAFSTQTGPKRGQAPTVLDIWARRALFHIMGEDPSPSNEYHRPEAFMLWTVKVGDVKKAGNFDRVYLTCYVAAHRGGQSTWTSRTISPNELSRGCVKKIHNKQGMALDWWGQTGPLMRGSTYTLGLTQSQSPLDWPLAIEPQWP